MTNAVRSLRQCASHITPVSTLCHLKILTLFVNDEHCMLAGHVKSASYRQHMKTRYTIQVHHKRSNAAYRTRENKQTQHKAPCQTPSSLFIQYLNPRFLCRTYVICSWTSHHAQRFFFRKRRIRTLGAHIHMYSNIDAPRGLLWRSTAVNTNFLPNAALGQGSCSA